MRRSRWSASWPHFWSHPPHPSPSTGPEWTGRPFLPCACRISCRLPRNRKEAKAGGPSRFLETSMADGSPRAHSDFRGLSSVGRAPRSRPEQKSAALLYSNRPRRTSVAAPSNRVAGSGAFPTMAEPLMFVTKSMPSRPLCHLCGSFDWSNVQVPVSILVIRSGARCGVTRALKRFRSRPRQNQEVGHQCLVCASSLLGAWETCSVVGNCERSHPPPSALINSTAPIISWICTVIAFCWSTSSVV